MELLGAIFIVLVSILTIVYGFFKYSFRYWKSRGFPSDEPSIPFGSIKGVGETVHMSEILKRLYEKYKPTGAKLCGAYVFTNPIAILFDLELIKCVFVKDFSKFHKNTYVNEIDDPLTANLVLLEGEKWKKLRAKLAPTFSSNKMKFMFPTVVGVGERFRDCLLQLVQKNDEFEMKELCARFTTDIIGTCAFGIECNSLNDPNAEFRRYGRKVFEKPRHSLLFFTILHMFKNVSKMFHLKTVPDDVTAFFMEAVRDTVEYRERNNISRNDFMDLLIKLKNEKRTNPEEAITFNELVAQVFVFFLAGYESSSTTLTCCFYELALSPRIQTKARRIIQEAYKKYNGEFTYEMMMDMPYIDQILEETLRKYPPASLLTRQAINDYPVPGSNIVIEKGTPVLIPIHAIHYDPEYYPNPETFDPERFSNEEKLKRDPMTYLAFGSGPRYCIAFPFGMMQARIGLVTLLSSFEVLPTPSTPAKMSINKKVLMVLTPEDVYLKLKPIKSVE